MAQKNWDISDDGVADFQSLIIAGNKWTWGTTAPTTGEYGVGDVRWNSAPTSTTVVGWICVTAGSPGTWEGFGLVKSD